MGTNFSVKDGIIAIHNYDGTEIQEKDSFENEMEKFIEFNKDPHNVPGIKIYKTFASTRKGYIKIKK